MLQIEDFVDWRNKARALLQAGVPPDKACMGSVRSSDDLFAPASVEAGLPTEATARSSTVSVPREFMQSAHWVAHHSCPERWQLLYSLAWRLVNEDKNLLGNPVDDQVRRFQRLRKAVTRDYHKMKAFVRFQSVADFTGEEPLYAAPAVLEPEQLHAARKKTAGKKSGNFRGEGTNTPGSKPCLLSTEDEHFIAWFEPEHFIVPLAAPFFVKRFNAMSWSILTPHECAHWHKGRLIFTGGATRPPMPEDQTEQLWLQYYAGIFNPARVKVKAMQAEMPKKYWKNLPEAQLIKELLQRATSRVDAMIQNNA